MKTKQVSHETSLIFSCKIRNAINIGITKNNYEGAYQKNETIKAKKGD